MKLLPKQKRFAEEYLIDHNATQAYIRAGYAAKDADVAGPRLLGNVGVAAYVAQRDQKVAERCEVSAEAVVGELAKIGLLDPRRAFQPDGMMMAVHDLPDDVAACIKRIRSNADGEIEEIEFWSKPQALELLGQRLALWKQVHEITGKGGKPIAMRGPSIDFTRYADDIIKKLANGNGSIARAG